MSVCFAARFRSGVEVGSRHLPPLKIMCYGLRAALAKENGTKRKTKIKLPNKIKKT